MGNPIYWTGAAGNGQWGNAGNWSPEQTPGVNDDVIIDASGTYTVSTQGYATDYANGLTIAATVTVSVVDTGTLDIAGAVQNSGSITVNQGDSAVLEIGSSADDAVKLTGGGAINLGQQGQIDAGVAGATLTNVDDAIQGSGLINGGFTLVNETQGVVDADQSNLTLDVYGTTITNTGVLEATNGGTLTFNYGATINNTGGQIEAAGGNVYLYDMTITGGTLETSSGGTIYVGRSNGVLLYNVANEGDITLTDVGSLSLAGDIDNSGSITVNQGDQTQLFIGSGADEDVTLSGGGSINVGGEGQINAGVAGATLTNVDDAIQGSGLINGGLTIVNEMNGVIDADASSNTLDIYGAAITNDGVLEATNSGNLQLNYGDVVNDTDGGKIEAAGGNVYLDYTTISGGALTSSDGGTIFVGRSNGVLLDGDGGDDVTNSGTIVLQDVGSLSLAGAIVNSGSISLVQPDQTTLLIGASVDEDVTLSGGGSVNVGGEGQIEAGVTGATLTNVDDAIQGYGLINGGLTIVNEMNGFIDANASSNTLDIYGAAITNDGVLEATNSGNLQLNYGATVDGSGGGKIEAAGGNVYLDNTTILGGTLETNAGTIFVGRSNGVLLDGAGGDTVTNSGSIVLQDVGSLTLAGAIDNTGSITLYQPDETQLLIGASVDIDATLSGGGSVSLGGEAQIVAGVAGGTLINVNNTIEGSGLFSVSLVNQTRGVIDANLSGQALDIYGVPVTNGGILEATNGGILNINYGASVNGLRGGVIEANGGNVNIGNVGIEGDTLVANGATITDNGALVDSGVIDISGGGAFVLNTSTADNVNFTGAGGTLELANTYGFGGTISATGSNNVVALPNLQIPGPIGDPPDSNGYPDRGVWDGNPYFPPELQIAYTGNSSGGVVSIVVYQHWVLFDPYNNGVPGSGGYVANSTIFSMNVSGDYTVNSFALEQVQGGGYAISLAPISSYAWAKGVSGDWSTAADWTPSGSPTANSAVSIAAPGKYTVTYDQGSTTLTSLSISHGAATLAITGGDLQLDDGTGAGTNAGTIDVSGYTTLTIGGTFANLGSVTLTSGGSYPTLSIDDAMSLTGAGSVVLDSVDGGIAQILADESGALTNLGNTIEGSGQIGGGDGRLTFDNSVGTVDANIAGGVLSVFTGDTVANSAKMEATSGGTLNLNDAIENAGGTILALGASASTISAAVVSDVISTPESTVNIYGGVAGGLVEASGVGSLVNIYGDVTSAIVKAILGGAIDVTQATLTGDTIGLTGAGSSLTLGYGAVVSEGTLTTGSGDEIDSTGGTLDGLTSAVTLSAGADLLVVDGGTLYLEGAIDDLGKIYIGDSTSAYNTELQVSGPVSLTGGGVVDLVATPNSQSYIFADGSGTLTNNGDKIIGAGTIGGDDGRLTLDNASGVIDANVAGDTLTIITGNALTNTATLEATAGGALAIDDGVTNTGGLIEALGGSKVDVYGPVTGGIVEASGAGSLVNISSGGVTGAVVEALAGGAITMDEATLAGDTISIAGAGSSLTLGFLSVIAGGTLTDKTGGVITSNDATLDGSTTTVTLTAGSTLLIADGTAMDVKGTIDDAGAIEVGDAASTGWSELTVSGPVSLTGGGKVLLTANGVSGSWIFGDGSDAGTLTNNGDTIIGAGGIDGNSSLDLTFDNAKGVVDANVLDQNLGIDTGNVATNAATMEATLGGILSLSDSVTNTGGVIEALAGSSVFIYAPVTGGVAQASGKGANLYITGGVIDATLKASGGGAIFVQTTTLASDMISVTGAGSSLTLNYESVVAGGTLSDSAGGTITSQDVTLDGSSAAVTLSAGSRLLVADAMAMDVKGTLNDAGVIEIGDAANTGWTEVYISGAVSLAGGGAVQLAASATTGFAWIFGDGSDPGTLTNNGDTLEGAGGISSNGSPSLTFDNATGIVDANVAGANLGISTGNVVTNTAKLEATGGGVLSLYDSVTNSGGTIEAFAGSTVNIDGAVTGGLLVAGGAGGMMNIEAGVTDAKIEAEAGGAITVSDATLTDDTTIVSGAGASLTLGYLAIVAGGTLTASAADPIEVSGATLDGTSSAVTLGAGSNLQIDDGAQLDLKGTIDNAGAIAIGDAASTSWTELLVSGAVTLKGAGTIALTSAATGTGWIWGDGSDPGTLTNTGDTIEGAGGIGYGGNGDLTFDNASGTVEATGGNPLSVDTGNLVTNSGVLEAANGAQLQIYDSVNNARGVISALSTGTVTLSGTVTGGTLKATDGSGATIWLDSATISGATLDGAANDAMETENYTVDTLAGDTLNSGGTVTDTGGATLDLSGSSVNKGVIAVVNATLDLQGSLIGIGTIDLGADAEIDLQGSVGSGQTLMFNGITAPVSLADASGFAGVLSGFGAGDAIDLLGFDANAKLAYSGNATSGTLTITDGSLHAKIAFDGGYGLAGFALNTSVNGETLTYA